MRRVACYAATSFLRAVETPESVGTQLISIVDSWLRSKGVAALRLGRQTSLLHDGRDVIIHFDHIVFNEDFIWEVSLEESQGAGRFLTRVCLGIGAGRVFLFLELRAGGDGMLVAPMNLDVRCPQVLRDLLIARVWTIGKTPARTKPFRWHGEDGANHFIEVVKHVDRNLPILAVSRSNGSTLTPSLPEELARDLSGLAIVADIDEAASWTVTNTLGKEWSCYNGAIRLYWPIRSPHTGAYSHPIWLREKMIEQAGDEIGAASRIRAQLRRQLLELSTYTFDEPRDFLQLRADAQRFKFDELRKEAERTGDQERLAEEFFTQSVQLEARLRDTEAENGRLRAQVQGLIDAFDNRMGQADDIPSELDGPVATVEDAVARARENFANFLTFGDDVEASVRELAEDAGPPDKIHAYLKTLAHMTEQRKLAGLGQDMLSWLREHGLKASGESETILNSSAEMSKRTWHDGDHRRPFEKHLKPADGTSPDRCVRVYFEFDEESGKTIVGYIGRHP